MGYIGLNQSILINKSILKEKDIQCYLGAVWFKGDFFKTRSFELITF